LGFIFHFVSGRKDEIYRPGFSNDFALLKDLDCKSTIASMPIYFHVGSEAMTRDFLLGRCI
jgi:hypothetical protein